MLLEDTLQLQTRDNMGKPVAEICISLEALTRVFNVKGKERPIDVTNLTTHAAA